MIVRCIAALSVLIALMPFHRVNAELAKPTPETNRPDQEASALRALVKEELVPAYRADKRQYVQKLLATVVAEGEDERLKKLDELLTDEFLPPAAEILADIHLTQSSKLKLNPFSPREAALVLQHAQASIKETLEQRDWVAMLDPNRRPEASFGEFERAIWDAHVYRNQLENAIKKTETAAQFQRRHRRAIKTKQPDFTETDFSSLRKNLYRARVELHERDLALKLDRIDFAIESLEELNQETEVERDSIDAARAKIWSVYVLQKDGQTLLRALKEYEKPRKQFEFLDHLNKSKTRSAARKKIKAGRKLVSRDLLERSEHLFDGLHWWFRGRYGRGTHNLGLLKPPAAAHNIKAQNALKMPRRPPRPTDPAMFARKGNHASDGKVEAAERETTQREATGLVVAESNQLKVANEQTEKESLSKVSPSTGHEAQKEHDYVYGIAYDKRYVRSPDYDRRHHYIWSQEPPQFVTQPVKMYFH